MARGVPLQAVPVAAILLLALLGHALMVANAPSAPLTPSEVSAEAIPCPNIYRSSPATASTNPGPVPLSPCPGIVAGIFLGGGNADYASDVAVDPAGNMYVTGSTVSPDFPTTPGAYDATFNGAVEALNTDAFLAKLSATGSLVFSTFLGGSGRDFGESITLDSMGNVYLAGSTSSTDFPTTQGAYDPGHPDIDLDNPAAFITKFESAGRVVYSTFLGDNLSGVSSISADPPGSVYFTGGLMGDVFVGKLNPDGTDITYSAVVGGGDEDSPTAIAVDGLGNAYVTGITYSPDFAVTSGAFDTTFNPPWPEEWGACCPYDGFLFKLGPDGAVLVYSTFIGGFDVDAPAAIGVDSLGSVWVAGSTWSIDFPVTPGAYNTSLVCRYSDWSRPDYPACDGATFLTGFDQSGMLAFGTFLSGATSGIDVDESGNIYLTGNAGEDFPTTPGAFDRTPNGGTDAFVAKFDANVSTLLYSTLVGGGDQVLLEPPEPGLIAYVDDGALAIAFDSSGNVTIVGATGSNDFPVPEGAYDTTYNGRSDAFVIRMEPIPEPNRAPYAYFDIVPPSENDSRVFVDASNSADAEDRDDLLEVRWDWEDDGVWDTAWSTLKTAWHAYAASGTYTIRLEVRDTGGLVGSTTREVAVRAPSSPEIAWIRQFEPKARGVAVDADGNAYVVGGRVGALVNNACTSHWSTGDREASLHKYDVNGDETWMRSFGNGSIGATAVAVDSTGAYVTGGTIGEFPGFHNAGFVDAYVLKYNADGNVMWTQQFGGSGLDAGYGIDVDATAVYVAGGSTCSGEMGGHAFVAKFDLDGNLIWTRRFGTAAGDRAHAVAVHQSGVYAAVDLGGQAWLRRLDPDGTTVWFQALSGLGCAKGVAVDATGIYAAGYTSWRCTDNFPFNGYTDAIIQKYDADGEAIWSRQFGTPGNDSAFGVSADATGVYAVGTTDGIFPDQASSGRFDAFVRKYSADGAEGWAIQFGPDIGFGIDVASSGIFAAGESFVARLIEGGTVPEPDLPPVLSVPGPITVEATGPSGTAVDYTATAVDDVDGSITPVCSPALGTVFPLGTTTVTCTAQDSAGNEATATFIVEVRDTRPPILTVPNDITVEATGPSGAAVTFEVTAADLVDPSPVVSCSPTSGSTFGIGTATVTCTATDFAGNTAPASFRVIVTEGDIRPTGFDFGPVAVAAIVVAVGGAVAAVAALMRRKGKGRDPGRDGSGQS